MTQLPIPNHFDRTRVGDVWRVPYQERAEQAKQWAKHHGLTPAAKDTQKTTTHVRDLMTYSVMLEAGVCWIYLQILWLDKASGANDKAMLPPSV